jgi:transcriptional regulator with XRE-family HTH domain
MTTAANIRKARHDAGLTQEQLAQRVGATRFMVNTWENGKHTPSRRYRPLVAQALGVKETDLFDDGEPSVAHPAEILDVLIAALTEAREKAAA